MCGQRTSFNRTREAGHLDEIQGSVANTMKLLSQGASPLGLPAVAGESFRSWLHRLVRVQTWKNRRCARLEKCETVRSLR